jgi:hypothetical protein
LSKAGTAIAAASAAVGLLFWSSLLDTLLSILNLNIRNIIQKALQ